jgi:flagellar hook protein FlgE
MVISSVKSSVSAINAAFEMHAASAHNVANSRTDGFKSLVTSTEENRNGSVTVNVTQNPEPGTVYDNENGEQVESSNVDYARETVNQMNAKHLLAANIAALKTYQDMEKSVIDIMA